VLLNLGPGQDWIGSGLVPETPPDLSKATEEELVELAMVINRAIELRPAVAHALHARKKWSLRRIEEATSWPFASVARWVKQHQRSEENHG
jgi:hypothetical protein